jgi:Cu/Ag efflux protein CusF
MIRLPKLYLALTVVGLLVIALTTPVLAATPVLPGQMQGKIMSVDADKMQFVLKTTAGEDTHFSMDEDAQVYINDKEAQLSDLRTGDQVSVVGHRDGDQWLAVEVRCNRDK